MSEGQQTNQNNDTEHILSHEAMVEEMRKCNLLSDIFMSVTLSDKLACQHVLRVLTGIKDLLVVTVRSQYRISKLASRDAILDVLAEDSNGRLYSLEIQRPKTIDHARRVRFYSSMADNEYLRKGSAFAALPDQYVVYISENDLWKKKRTAYMVKKSFEDTEVLYADGLQIIYVNAAVDDGSEIAGLMRYFKTASPNDMSQGDLSKRVRFLKSEEGGYQIMCAICDKIYQEGREEGEELGRAAERQIWQIKIADKDAAIADKDALIAKLMLKIGDAVL